jgi:hypothetical protein
MMTNVKSSEENPAGSGADDFIEVKRKNSKRVKSVWGSTG